MPKPTNALLVLIKKTPGQCNKLARGEDNYFFDDNITCCIAVDFIDADLQSGRVHQAKVMPSNFHGRRSEKGEEKEAEGNDRLF